MATYLILNLLFMAIVIIALRITPRKPPVTWLIMFGVLIMLTAVFDSLIITAGIVGYDIDKILGIYIGKAPIEDFFYAIMAAIVIPILWKKSGKSHA